MKLIIQSVVVALVVISMVISIKYLLLHSNYSGSNAKEVVRLKGVKDCNILQSECLLFIDNKQLRLKLLGNIRTMQPFNLVAQVQNFNSDIDNISATFSMKSMDMGFNSFKLTKKHLSNNSSRIGFNTEQWQTSVLLPVCVSKRADWQMLVRVETLKNILEVDIPIRIK